MEFSRQECWGGLPFSPPGILSYPGMEPLSPALEARFVNTDLISEMPEASFVPTTVIKSTFDGAD